MPMPLGSSFVVFCMSDMVTDDVIAIDMDGEMRVRLADWTPSPSWAYDALYERVRDSRSVEWEAVSDGDRLGKAHVNTDDKTIIFVPN